MKTLGRIKLNQLSKAELEEREIKLLVGGCNEVCGCRADNDLNSSANLQGGYHVKGGPCEDITYNGGTIYVDDVVAPYPKK